MKKLILLAVFALMFIVSAPKQADALLLDKIFDDIPGPHCLISDCDDDDDGNDHDDRGGE